MGPKSRVHPRFVGKGKNSTRLKSTPQRVRMLAARAWCALELTRILTTSPGAIFLTISP